MPPYGMGNHGLFQAAVNGLFEELIAASRDIAAGKAKAAKARKARGRGASEAASGALWQALAARVAPHLAKRGAKAMLARELGVSRQQIHCYFKTRTTAPDADRVLRLLVWLAQTEGEASRPATKAAAAVATGTAAGAKAKRAGARA
jgi:hypothetical protein